MSVGNPLAARAVQRKPGQKRRVDLGATRWLVGVQRPLVGAHRDRQHAQQLQSSPLAFNERGQHVPGGRLGKARNQQREAAAIAGGDRLRQIRQESPGGDRRCRYRTLR